MVKRFLYFAIAITKYYKDNMNKISGSFLNLVET